MPFLLGDVRVATALWALCGSVSVDAVLGPQTHARPPGEGGQGLIVEIPQPDLTTAEPQVREKISTMHRLLAVNQPNAEIWGQYAILLDVHDCAPSAEIAYARAHELAEDDFRWVYFHATMVRETQPHKALALLQESIRIKPGYVPALVRLGVLYETLGRPDEAWGSYESARQRDPDNASARLHYGQMALHRGDLELAVSELRAAVSLAPDDRSALSSLARALHRGGWVDEAREAAEAARGASSNHLFVDPLYQRSRAEAVNVEAMIARGRALRDAGRLDEALAELQRALTYDPHHALLRRIIVSVHLRRGDHAAAVGAYRAALVAKPDDPTLARGLAIALAELGRYDEAVERLRRQRAVDPRDMVIANELAWLLAVCPDPAVRNGAEAVRLAEVIVATPGHGTAAALDTLAAAYAATGRYDDAVRTMQQAIERIGADGDGQARAARYRQRLDLYRVGKPYRMAR